MAEVTTFVDDAVLGRLPGVCAIHGRPTGDQVIVRRPMGPSRVRLAWLVALLGPFALLVARTGGDVLTTRVPCCSEAYLAHRRARRWCGVAAILGVALCIGTLVAAQHNGSLGWRTLAIACAAFGAAAGWLAVRFQREARRNGVEVSLDASRRWVTISGVHPRFAAAVTESRRGVDQLS